MKHRKDQLDLFADAPAPPAQRHSPTSMAAAEAIAPCAESLRRQVLDYIASAGQRGMTDEEVHDHFGGNPGTFRARRVELMAMGNVIDSGRKRKTRSGREAVVWVASQPISKVG